MTDLHLPDMHGFQVAKVLKQQGFSGKLLALSGSETMSSRQQAAEVGFDLFLSKPVEPVLLKERLRAWQEPVMMGA